MRVCEIELAAARPHDCGLPELHTPAVYGVSPGKPLLYRIPATGAPPLRFHCDPLPEEMTLDETSGILSGTVARPGNYPLRLAVENASGCAEKDFTLCVGAGMLLQTPMMSFCSWNAFAEEIDAEKIRRSAELLVSRGLAARGYSYVNIDSGWQGRRDAESGVLRPNDRFGDFKPLCDAIHALGLKAGIYSTPMLFAYGTVPELDLLFPGETSGYLDCAYADTTCPIPSFGIGQTRWEAADVAQYVKWGFDYLKYDWNPVDEANLKAMYDCLAAAPRDFVLNVTGSCRLADTAVWRRYATIWRNGIDLLDEWGRLNAIAFGQDDYAAATAPGFWYDLDMLAVGRMRRHCGKPHDCLLTPEEQILQLSMWALFPSPLQIGCDLAALDDFTLALLTNEEVLAVNQDLFQSPTVPLEVRRERGLDGRELRHTRIYGRKLADGSEAVGCFNPGDSAMEVDFPVGGTLRVRDLWARRDISATERLQLSLPPHGARLFRIWR